MIDAKEIIEGMENTYKAEQLSLVFLRQIKKSYYADTANQKEKNNEKQN